MLLCVQTTVVARVNGIGFGDGSDCDYCRVLPSEFSQLAVGPGLVQRIAVP